MWLVSLLVGIGGYTVISIFWVTFMSIMFEFRPISSYSLEEALTFTPLYIFYPFFKMIDFFQRKRITLHSDSFSLYDPLKQDEDI